MCATISELRSNVSPTVQCSITQTVLFMLLSEHGLFIRRFDSSDRAQMKIKAYIDKYFDQTCLTSKRDCAMFYIGSQDSFKPI